MHPQRTYKFSNIIISGQRATDESTEVPERTTPKTFSNLSLKTIDLDKESYHKLFDILKQYQKEGNIIRAEKIVMNENPLAVFADAQPYQETYYQAPKPQKSYPPPTKQSSSTKSHASTRHKGKEIAKPITPPSELASEEDSDIEQVQRDKDMQKNLALIAKYFKKLYKPTNNNLRTSSNSKNKNVDNTPRYINENQTGQFENQRTVTVAGARETVGSQVVQQTGIQCFYCKEFRHFAKDYRKPKRAKDYTYHKEKMLMCKQAKKGVPLQTEQVDWLEDTDEEVDKQELESHYMYMNMCMEKIQEVHNVDSGPSFDAEPLEKVYYDDDYNVFANERQHSEQTVSITNTCVVKKVDSNVIPDSSDMCDNDIQAMLKNCKSTLEETNRTLGESNRTRDRYLGTLHDKEVELAKYKNFKDHTIENDTLERKLKETLELLAQKEHDIKEGLKLKAYKVSVVKEKNDELIK
ncbi:hypothetical protein Tco_1324915 [Tanacetum coccineum]